MMMTNCSLTTRLREREIQASVVKTLATLIVTTNLLGLLPLRVHWKQLEPEFCSLNAKNTYM